MDVISKHSATEHPTMSPLFVGTTFKVLEVAGLAGVSMPLHYSTGEAVISVKSGKALLEIDDYQHFLKSGDSFLIPRSEERRVGTERRVRGSTSHESK